MGPEDGAAAATGAEEEDDGWFFGDGELEFEQGSRRPIAAPNPRKPSSGEVAEHELTHLPFRSWCAHCVRGKGKSADHRKVQEDRGIDEVHVDYCFMGGNEDSFKNTILVAKHIQSKAVMCSVVPKKGSTHEFPARRTRAFCRELGLEHADVIVKGDQEPALQDLVREIGRARAPAKTIPEQSPVKSSGSNGHVERAIQAVEGQIRVIKDALEAKIKVKVPANHDVVAWLVEFAGVLLNRYGVAADGKTAYERLKGKKSKLLGIEFGEKVHFRRQAVGDRLAKLDVMWEDGIFLGYRPTSGEMIIGTSAGVMRTRTVRRRPEEERWGPANLELVVGVPWQPNAKEEDREEGDAMPHVCIEPKLPSVPVLRPEVVEPAPRRLYVRGGDLKEHGTTAGCKGCLAWLRGGKTVTHSDACRDRVAKSMKEKGDAKGRLAAQRQRENEYCAEVLRKDDERRGQKRGADGSAGDEERANRVEIPERGQKREADASIEEAPTKVRGGAVPGGVEDSAAASAPGSASASSAANPPSTKRAEEEGKDDDMIDNIYLVEACRGPEEDVEDSWEAEEDFGGALNGDQYIAEFLDDRTGKPLDTAKVRAAREEELAELERRVFKVVDVEECWAKKSKGPIPVRWVDVDKGFGVHRSRLVAKDFKPKSTVGDRDDLFAATPPLEAIKILVAQAAAQSAAGKQRKVMFIDIGKAHLYGPMDTDEYVELPPERAQPGKCAKLLYTLYGMRMAARNWEREYTRVLKELGFAIGKASSVAFYHPVLGIRVVVHGDDFIIEGEEQHLWWLHDELQKRFIVKMRGVLGPEEKDANEVVVLNRVLRWTDGEFHYEADPRHVEQMLKAMGMEDCKACATPGIKARQGELMDEAELDAERHRAFRSVVARANFLALDRPDIRYTVKELCRRMSGPRECDWSALKRLCRYLRGKPRVIQRVPLGGEVAKELEVYVKKAVPDEWEEDDRGAKVEVLVDSDWAGCRETRRSTSGGCIMFRGVCLKVWSTTQKHIALSSGEAEYYAAVKGGTEALFVQALCLDLGIHVGVKVFTDSSACKGVCNRDGLGKLRHLDLQYLWLQEAVRSGRLQIKKVAGAWNPADLMTKFLSQPEIIAKMGRLGMQYADGRTALLDAI